MGKDENEALSNQPLFIPRFSPSSPSTVG